MRGDKAYAEKMLTALLRMPAGKLPRGEQQQAEDIWDALHRYGKLTSFQMQWVVKRYSDHGLDDPNYRPPPRMATVKLKVGYLEDAEFGPDPVRVKTLKEFEDQCPQHPKGSRMWEKAAAFLRDAGHVIELRRPKETSGAP